MKNATGCLPHTGSDLVWYVLAGVVLIVFGLTLWAATKERQQP